MDKNVIKALINMVLVWLLVSLVLCFKNHISYVDALKMPKIIIIAIVAGVASYAGFTMKNK